MMVVTRDMRVQAGGQPGLAENGVISAHCDVMDEGLQVTE